MKKGSFFFRIPLGAFLLGAALYLPLPVFAVSSNSLKLTSDQLNMAENLFHFYEEKGWPENAIIGIITNLYFECSLDPTEVNAVNGASGLAQWLGGRRKNFVEKYGVLPHEASWKQQAEFIQQDLTDKDSPYRFVGQELMSAESAKSAAIYFGRDYEVPGRTTQEAESVAEGRAKIAQSWKDLLESTENLREHLDFLQNQIQSSQ
ncbi:hypothetical protein FAI40_08785 [Acetobacteraceae bacterium]|nr:hypothetical protein FAI40_08785 [Acetobacteraceae bacterium]